MGSLRRRFLALAGGIVGLAAGYVAVTRPSGGSVDAPDDRRYELGRAAELSVEGTPDRAFELEDDGETVLVEYNNGDVETYDFDEWAPGVAASVASEGVARVLGTRISTDDLTIGFGAVDVERLRDAAEESPAFDGAVGPIVTWPAPAAAGGDAERPGPSFDEVLDATPRSVDATVDFDGREFAGRLPVVCKSVRRERY